MSHFGLDIGASSIKVVQIDRVQNFLKLIKVGTAVNPIGSLTMDSDRELVSLAETVKKLVDDLKFDFREVAIALPESQVFSSVIEMPQMSDDQLEQAVIWEAENIVPRPLAEVSFSWKTIEGDDTKSADKLLKVLIVAAPLTLIERYAKLMKLANLDNRLIETEMISIGRVIKLINADNDYVAMLQIGQVNTNIAIYRGGELLLSRTLTSAGSALTRGVATGLSMDQQESEEYKKAYGLSKQLEGKIATSLAPVLDNITLEVKKTLSNFEQKENCHIKRMLLGGGSALMIGVAEYFTTKLGIEVQLVDPTAFIQVDPSLLTEVKKQSPALMVAYGLALAEI